MVAAINEVNTVQASAGAAYGESCQMYEAKADKKLANSDMICLAGYGCGLKVEHNALIVRQGYSHEGQKPTTTILHRGVHGIKSIVILSDSGNISLDSIRFCSEQGICISIIDRNGSLQQSLTTDSVSNAALRRKPV